MKRIMSFFLIFICLTVPSTFASDLLPVDVTELEDIELKALYVAIKNELMERKLWDESILPAGIYVGGKNLPEGYYELTLNDGDIVAAWKNYEEYLQDTINDPNHTIFYEYLKKGTKLTMSLVDGMCWRIPCDAIVRPFVGLDW